MARLIITATKHQNEQGRLIDQIETDYQNGKLSDAEYTAAQNRVMRQLYGDCGICKERGMVAHVNGIPVCESGECLTKARGRKDA